jgi:predicted Zn-dependent protease
MGLARAYAANRAFPEAIRELNEAIRLSADAPGYIAELARTYAAARQPDRARALLARLQEMSTTSQTYVAPQSFAIIYAALGENDHAFQFLESSMNERRSGLLWARVDPRLDGLHPDRRFAALLQRIGPPSAR